MNTGKQRLWYLSARSWRYFFHRQIWHLSALLILVPVSWTFAAPAMNEGSWLGITDAAWFWLATGVPVLHQLIVWIVFRLQLGWAVFTRIFGGADLFVWSVLFIPFLAARPVLVFGLAKATRTTLELPQTLAAGLALLLILPAIYTFWSTIRYFGIRRAIGGDHFRTAYRQMPLVRQGAFKYNSNAMYAFAFFLLWSIALFTGSQAALSVAIFQHAYVWVHYYCTEKPDMKLIYELPADEEKSG